MTCLAIRFHVFEQKKLYDLLKLLQQLLDFEIQRNTILKIVKKLRNKYLEFNKRKVFDSGF